MKQAKTSNRGVVMQAQERRKYILEKLNLSGIVNVHEISQELGIHETTIRRDLEKLEKEGKLTRVHGGAILNEEENVELTMNQKMVLNYEAKKVVCKKACEYVQDGDCVFIDGGTTTYSMIEYLASKKIKIVTHSDLIIRQIKKCEAEIITVGGRYLPHYSMSVGASTIAEISKYHYDHCFIGCVGINVDEQMSYTSEQETLDVKRAAMENSDKKYLLIDASKLNVRGFCKFASLDEFDKIICNKFYIKEGSIENLELVK